MYQTRDDGEKLRPAQVHQGVIAKQPVEPSLMQPAHVEGAVAIEQAIVRLHRQASEAEIAIQGPLGGVGLRRGNVGRKIHGRHLRHG